jgi:hypothetical protein
MPPNVQPTYQNPTAGGRAFGDALGLFAELHQAAWKWAEFNNAKRALRKVLNDAVFALGQHPEGFYVPIVMVTRDLSAGSVKGMIALISTNMGQPRKVEYFQPNQWQMVEPPGNRQHLLIVHNVNGICPRNLPSQSMGLDAARATLAKF